jgi:hypothetical protein
MSTILMKFLACFYIVVMLISFSDGEIGRGVYWLGACIITLGVLMGT